MKNLAYLFLFVGIAFACGDDDDPPAPMPVDFEAAINSGGPAVSTSGNDWEADKDNDAANVFTTADLTTPAPDLEIDGTEDDELYRSEVNDGTGFSYNIAVPAEGPWSVDLHFAEIYFGVDEITDPDGTGLRVFDVDIENGQATLTDYDIVAEAGGSATAVVETFNNINVTDGSLTITFTAKVEAPKVSAVRVSGSYIP